MQHRPVNRQSLLIFGSLEGPFQTGEVPLESVEFRLFFGTCLRAYLSHLIKK